MYITQPSDNPCSCCSCRTSSGALLLLLLLFSLLLLLLLESAAPPAAGGGAASIVSHAMQAAAVQCRLATHLPKNIASKPPIDLSSGSLLLWPKPSSCTARSTRAAHSRRSNVSRTCMMDAQNKHYKYYY
jgi:hypothetical protein